MNIPLKTVRGTCGCGCSFEYTVPAGINDPTLCEDCVVAFQDKMEAQRRQHSIRDFVISCGIAEKYRTWDPVLAESLGSDRILKMATASIDDSMWLLEKKDRGKTHAAIYAAYRAVIDHGKLCLVIRAADWFGKVTRLRTGSNSKREEAEDMVRRAIATRLLIIDDLGKETMNHTKAEILFNIVDERDIACKPVWITTNFGGKTLRARLNDVGNEDHGIGTAVLVRLGRMIKPEHRMIPQELKDN